jgi:hypothetical protein
VIVGLPLGTESVVKRKLQYMTVIKYACSPTFSEREHIVRFLAVMGPSYGIDSSHPEAIRGEGKEVLHLINSRIVIRLENYSFRFVPTAVLPDPDMYEVVGHW